MEERVIKINLGEAKKWYNSNNSILKIIALKAFSKKELTEGFQSIRNFVDACNRLGIDSNKAIHTAQELSKMSKASAAMFRLNIIRKALNSFEDISLIEGRVYYPYNPFITSTSTHYKKELEEGKLIRTNCFIIYKGIKYEILGGHANLGSTSGVGHFHSGDGMGSTWADVGFLGCATEEIAKYISSKFGKLITEAKYGDLEGIQIL